MNTCLYANEIDNYACAVYRKHWNDNTLEQGDIRQILTCGGPNIGKTIDVLCGGDPCPSRSLAKGNRQSNHPDLAGYYLAVVARLRPQWVVRENVPAPDAIDFAAALELLGYGVTSIGLDARDFTGQSRRRQFIIGCPIQFRTTFERAVSDKADAFGFASSSSKEETPIAACLTAHPSRMAAEDTYCYESGYGLRRLHPDEAEVLQGFPRGWTAGLSQSRRRVLIGNAVNVQVIKWIAERLMEVIGLFTFAELFAGIGGFRLGFELAS